MRDRDAAGAGQCRPGEAKAAEDPHHRRLYSTDTVGSLIRGPVRRYRAPQRNSTLCESDLASLP